MNKKITKMESKMSCKATASLKAEVSKDMLTEDGDLEELLEKSRNSHDYRKDTSECSPEDRE